MVLPPNKRQKAPKTARTRFPCRLSQFLRVQQVALTVLPVGSVGASALCAEVSRPAPFAREAKRANLISLDEARFSHFIGV